jgi:hypothetical protein
VSSSLCHSFNGARADVLLSLSVTIDDANVEHVPARYSVTMNHIGSLVGPRGGMVGIECVQGCVGHAEWHEGDTTYLGVMERAWSGAHGLPVNAGADLPDHREE